MSSLNEEDLFEVDNLRIKIDFTSPDLVSLENYDKVAVQVSRKIFIDELTSSDSDEQIFIDMDNVDSTKKLRVPKQLSEDQVVATKMMTETAGSLMVAFLSTNIFISIFSAGALQYLWGLINAIQIIVLTSLFRITLPHNVGSIITAVWKLVSLDLFQTDSIF